MKTQLYSPFSALSLLYVDRAALALHIRTMHLSLNFVKLSSCVGTEGEQQCSLTDRGLNRGLDSDDAVLF